jgi:transcriptional regulator with XRE-family HTH domain
MFTNLGKTLSLLRELRGKSQARVAREAGIGKSQLSKYENGKELPKLDSLEKVLKALAVGHFEFFYTLYLVDRRAEELARSDAGPGGSASEVVAEQLFVPPFLRGTALVSQPMDLAFSQIFSDLFLLYRSMFEQIVLKSPPGDFKPSR